MPDTSRRSLTSGLLQIEALPSPIRLKKSIHSTSINSTTRNAHLTKAQSKHFLYINHPGERHFNPEPCLL
ncbi:hypothetical protein BCEP4_2310008 [Burkholderia cepacia]|nr:hypothetical protein BCEP4_2310008 [Burkholderia cepacia]